MINPELPNQTPNQHQENVYEKPQFNENNIKYDVLPSNGQHKFLSEVKGVSISANYCCIFQKAFHYKIRPYDSTLTDSQNQKKAPIAYTEKGEMGACEKQLFSMQTIFNNQINVGLFKTSKSKCFLCPSKVHNVYTGANSSSELMATITRIQECKLCGDSQNFIAIKDANGKLLYTIGKWPVSKCCKNEQEECCNGQCKGGCGECCKDSFKCKCKCFQCERKPCCTAFTCCSCCQPTGKKCPEYYLPVMDAEENFLPRLYFQQTMRQCLVPSTNDHIYKYEFPQNMPDTHRYLILLGAIFAQAYRY